MSASEVIELIKKLPPEERKLVLAFAEETRNAERRNEGAVSPSPAFTERAERIFAQNSELFRRLAQ